MAIDWTNPEDQVTAHFKVRDCITLHNWNRLATEADGVDFDAMVALCEKMEQVRDLLGCAIKVHCMFRSQDYNKEQGIKPDDVHSKNIAADFDCSPALSIQEVKDKLEPELENLGIRMERGTTTWVHVDTRAPGPSGRYFTA